MAKIKTDLEIRKDETLKAYRSAIRLKHSINADAEIARVLPEVEARIEAAWQRGEELTLNPGEVFIEQGI